jgi:hypothetical protein
MDQTSTLLSPSPLDAVVVNSRRVLTAACRRGNVSVAPSEVRLGDNPARLGAAAHRSYTWD